MEIGGKVVGHVEDHIEVLESKEHLKWAPFLLSADEYSAGNIEVSMPNKHVQKKLKFKKIKRK